MIRNSTRRWLVGALATVLTLLSGPIARAGQNTLTGGRAFGSGASAGLVAADPSNPYVVYAAFQSVLYRSGDGGRTWLRLKGGFNAIDALLVHPAEPTTIYISTEEGNAIAAVYRSTDSGASWTRLALSDVIQVLAGDPSDASTIYAGGLTGRVWKSSDKGANWTSSQNISGLISQLVVDPHQRANVYVGTESDYYYFNFGEFAKSTDSAATFVAHNPGPFKTVSALAADPLSPSKLYMGLESDASTSLRGFFSSSDGGTTWAHTGAGLPDGTISSIVANPAVLGTLFAGTPSGIFRSRDAGATWAAFGSRLGLSVSSLTMSGDGRFLHAGTNAGAFDLEFVDGPVDVAGAPSGESRVLVWSADQLSLATLNAAGQWSSATHNDPSTTWTATAIAVGADGDTRILWQSHDGRWGLEITGPLRDQIVGLPQMSVDPVDIAVAANGETWVLAAGATGQMYVARMDAFSAPTFRHAYGPAPGWSAVAIADSPEGAWVLWRCADGRAGLSLHDADGRMLRSFQWPASPGFAAEDIAVGADGRVRLLGTSANARAEVSTVESGQLTSGQIYSNFGYVPRRISTGADGLTRILWNYAGGHGSVWLLNADNTVKEKHELPHP
jgi:photosystem II stability/assembly factor-like uncharacterized protein